MYYQPIIGTLGFILSADRKKVLMVYRNKRGDDLFLGKYNGLGGKMMPEENVKTCMIREIQEEAGILCTKMQLRGTVNWTGFGPNGEDWLGFIFLIEEYEGEPWSENVEGSLSFIDIDQLHTLPMWEGDRLFLPLVFDNNPEPFHIHMPYKEGQPIGFNCTR